MQAHDVGPPKGYVLFSGILPRRPVGSVRDRLFDAGEHCAKATGTDRSAHRGWRQRVIGGGRIQDRGAQAVAVGMAELERGKFLRMRVEQPWMIDNREQNQRL